MNYNMRVFVIPFDHSDAVSMPYSKHAAGLSRRRCLQALAGLALTGRSALGAETGLERWQRLGAELNFEGTALVSIFFRDSSHLEPSDFRQMGKLPRLKKLVLYGRCVNFDDDALGAISGLVKLEQLLTAGVSVSDAGLKHLSRLKELKSLSFFHPSMNRSDFTGAGLVHCLQLEKLERLTIAGSSFNDEGMAAVTKLTQLREFGTWHTQQTATGNEWLPELKQLRSLRIGQRWPFPSQQRTPASLSNATIPILTRMKSLESLALDEARLNYAGLSQLSALPKLKRLILSSVAIEEEEVNRLRTLLPMATIQWIPPDERRGEMLRRYDFPDAESTQRAGP